jgi:hypothetical protein
MSLNFTKIYVTNFEKFINNDNVKIDKNYFAKLYKIIYSKRVNTVKIHQELLSKAIIKYNLLNNKKSVSNTYSTSTNTNNNNINIRINGGDPNKVWIENFEELINKLEKTNIDLFWSDLKDTTFNKFRIKYNKLISCITFYKNVLDDIKNKEESLINQNKSYLELLTNIKFKYAIKNIYNNIVKNSPTRINNTNIKNKTDYPLYYYYNKMVKETKDINKKKHDYSIKIVGTNKSNINATTKNGKFLAKFRKIKFGSDKELHISVLYYKIRKIGQILMLLLPTFIYYYENITSNNSRKYLLNTILLLRSLISRSNLNDSNIQKHKSIQNAFKRILKSIGNDGNNIENLFKRSNLKESIKKNKELRNYINKLYALIKKMLRNNNAAKTINEVFKNKLVKKLQKNGLQTNGLQN